MSQRTLDTLNTDTLRTEPGSARERSHGIPCLTVLSSEDPSRIGSRMLMPCLLSGQRQAFSRGEGLFAHSHEAEGRPLSDPYISRQPIIVQLSEGQLVIDSVRTPVSVDGAAAAVGAQRIEARKVPAGVCLRLSRHTVLLLHIRSEPPTIHIPEIAGDSDAIRGLRMALERAAGHDDPVMICGETGTGKELVARALHARSRRAEGPFVAVNMATLSAATAASALFGHVRGAFTGADRRHHGLFERADGGVLFLDEVGDTPPEVQPMLLRALETQHITPLGAEQECAVDVRVVAATDLDLLRAIDTGRFRSPLLHRLSVLRMDVPALRERKDDLGRLAVRFINEVITQYEAGGAQHPSAASPSQYVTAAWIERLLRAPLAGNVRELRNLSRRRALDLLDGREPDGPPEPHDSRSAAAGDKGRLSTLPSFEPAQSPSSGHGPPTEEQILEVLADHDYVPERAARALGLSSSTMHYFIQRSDKLRRATDYSVEELREALARHHGDAVATAQELRVSRRALTMALRKRGLLS